MVDAFHNSKTFVKECKKYIPMFIRNYVQHSTLNKALSFIGIFFIVSPKARNDEIEWVSYLVGCMYFLPESWRRKGWSLAKSDVAFFLFVFILLTLTLLLSPLGLVLGACYHLCLRGIFMAELIEIVFLLARITFGILLCCSVLRIIYETFTLCFRMLSLLHLCENGLKLTQFLFEISLLLLSKPLLWLWYILSALLSEPLQFVCNTIYSVFIQCPVAISKWIYRGPIAYLIDKLVIIVSIPLNILYQGISLILWLIGRPFIWLYILFESIFTHVAGLLFTLCKVIETVFYFLINIPILLATLAYVYSYYILIVMMVIFAVYIARFYNKTNLIDLKLILTGGKYQFPFQNNNQAERPASAKFESNNQAEGPIDARDPHYFETTAHSANDR